METNLRTEYEGFDMYDYQLNITYIDKDIKTYEAISSTIYGVSSKSEYEYACDNFITRYLLGDSFFNADYIYDNNTEQILLSNFNLQFDWIYNWLLLENDWEIINDAFVNLFNASAVLASIPDYDNPEIIIEITLEDFLAHAIDYKIINCNSLEKALNCFINDYRWTFFLDLSGVLAYSIYDFTQNQYEYFIYDEYKVTTELEYTSNGQLDTYSYKVEYKITLDNIITNYVREREYTFGGIKSLNTNFTLITTISSFVSITLIAGIKRRKMRN